MKITFNNVDEKTGAYSLAVDVELEDFEYINRLNENQPARRLFTQLMADANSEKTDQEATLLTMVQIAGLIAAVYRTADVVKKGAEMAAKKPGPSGEGDVIEHEEGEGHGG